MRQQRVHDTIRQHNDGQSTDSDHQGAREA
jgi:hypothetical protein